MLRLLRVQIHFFEPAFWDVDFIAFAANHFQNTLSLTTTARDFPCVFIVVH